MLNGTIHQVAKQSFLYSYVLSQPFSVYVDAYPVLENNKLMEAEHISFGEHGEAVRILQEKMNRLDYYDDDIDGEFGIFTEHALKKIQTDMNINITGEADYHTLYSIVEQERQNYLEELKTMNGSVSPGMKSEDVKIVQKALQYFGYYTGEIDGIYGPLTTKAVDKAEDVHQIQLTPEVTTESLETLYDRSEDDAPVQKADDTKTEHTAQATVEESQTQVPAEQTAKEKKPKKHPVKKMTQSKNGIVQTARTLIGTPYVWGGTTPGGFDCSGFIQYVFESHNITTPRTVSDMWNFTSPVSSRSIGDLVFFETYKPGPSHMGVYIGDGNFIHAGSSTGVSISNLNDDYWEKRYLGTRRVQ